MTLPKWATTVTPLSKTIALIIFISFPILGFFLGMNYQSLIDKNDKIENIIPNPDILIRPTIIPMSESTSTIVTPTSILNENKLYLVKKINDDNTNIYSILPKGSTIKYNKDNRGYISANVMINNQEYSFDVQWGGRGGPCPMTDNDSTHCGYEDKNISTIKGVTIGAVRIWKSDVSGIFLLDPWDINIEGKYNINSIFVTKKDQNAGFNQDEVNTWLKIFSQINIEKF